MNLNTLTWAVALPTGNGNTSCGCSLCSNSYCREGREGERRAGEGMEGEGWAGHCTAGEGRAGTWRFHQVQSNCTAEATSITHLNLMCQILWSDQQCQPRLGTFRTILLRFLLHWVWQVAALRQDLVYFLNSWQLYILDSHRQIWEIWQSTHHLRLVPFDAHVGNFETIYDHVKGRLPLDKGLEALQLLGEGETFGYPSYWFKYLVKCFVLPF